MADSWIKMRVHVMCEPKFNQLCTDAGLSRVEALRCLYETACWFAEQGEHGKLGAEPALIDAYLHQPGFAAAMMGVDWLRHQRGVLTLHGFCDISGGRKPLGVALRRSILNGSSCTACGSTSELVVDHKIPIVRGGTCERSNLQVLCAPCNRAKGRRTMREFMAQRRMP